MHLTQQTSIRNDLLRALPADAFGCLQPFLQPVLLPRRFEIAAAGTRTDPVFFPDGGLGALLGPACGPGQQQCIGLFGREGLSDASIALGSSRPRYRTVMVIKGNGHLIAADDLSRAMERSPILFERLLDQVHALMLQIAETALANSACATPERLARLLALTLERLDGPAIGLTHDALAGLLGIRREGVTAAMRAMERDGVVQTDRGLVTVLDRAALLQAATRTGVPLTIERGRPEQDGHGPVGTRERAEKPTKPG